MESRARVTGVPQPAACQCLRLRGRHGTWTPPRGRRVSYSDGRVASEVLPSTCHGPRPPLRAGGPRAVEPGPFTRDWEGRTPSSRGAPDSTRPQAAGAQLRRWGRRAAAGPAATASGPGYPARWGRRAEHTGQVPVWLTRGKGDRALGPAPGEPVPQVLSEPGRGAHTTRAFRGRGDAAARTRSAAAPGLGCPQLQPRKA